MKHPQAIAIVAHPDDETIWMGGQLLDNRQFDWTIFCLCRSSDPDRAPKFKKVCAHYGAKAIMTDLNDEGDISLRQAVIEIKKLIAAELAGKKFVSAFTHGADGEYGHYLHRAVYQAVAGAFKSGDLKADSLYFFNYRKADRRKFPAMVARKNSDLFGELSEQTFREKKKVMTDIYGFDSKGPDVGYCTAVEGFRKY